MIVLRLSRSIQYILVDLLHRNCMCLVGIDRIVDQQRLAIEIELFLIIYNIQSLRLNKHLLDSDREYDQSRLRYDNHLPFPVLRHRYIQQNKRRIFHLRYCHGSSN